MHEVNSLRFHRNPDYPKNVEDTPLETLFEHSLSNEQLTRHFLRLIELEVIEKIECILAIDQNLQEKHDSSLQTHLEEEDCPPSKQDPSQNLSNISERQKTVNVDEDGNILHQKNSHIQELLETIPQKRTEIKKITRRHITDFVKVTLEQLLTKIQFNKNVTRKDIASPINTEPDFNILKERTFLEFSPFLLKKYTFHHLQNQDPIISRLILKALSVQDLDGDEEIYKIHIRPQAKTTNMLKESQNFIRSLKHILHAQNKNAIHSCGITFIGSDGGSLLRKSLKKLQKMGFKEGEVEVNFLVFDAQTQKDISAIVCSESFHNNLIHSYNSIDYSAQGLKLSDFMLERCLKKSDDSERARAKKSYTHAFIMISVNKV